MAAVALFAAGLVVLAVGSVEALGSVSARSTIDLIDLPLGPSKREHVEMLEQIAADADVSLVLLTPERSGAPNELDAYVLHGGLPRPVFWGEITERPASAIDDAVIAWTYAVDGEPTDVARFFEDLHDRGFAFVDSTPQAVPTLVDVFRTPGVAIVGVAVAVGVVVALVADSHRRASRQRVRRLAGRTSRRIAVCELVDLMVLIAAVFGTVFGALSLFLVVRSAGHAVWVFSALSAALVVPAAVSLVAALHVVLAMVSGYRLDGVDAGRWRAVVVGVSGVVLVALIAAGASGAVVENSRARQLERSLSAEAEHGDDVVLGVGFSDEEQEDLLGDIGRRALVSGTARMAMTNAIPEALLVIGDGTPGVASDVVHRDGVTVLIPHALAGRARAVEDTVLDGIAEGWEVDDSDPPRRPRVRSEIVPSTDAIVHAAGRWVELGFPDSTGPLDTVVVVAGVEDIAPNRIATATRNGEVRFSDRAALVRALHRSGVFDVVTQVNRVGAVVDRRLAEVRAEQLGLAGATIAAGLAALFVASSLVADHRTRRRDAAAVRSLTGRHPAVHHVPFVLGAAGVTGVTVFATLGATGLVGAAVVVPAAGAVCLATLVLTIQIVVDRLRGKDQP
ncbi:hypothetical protein [Curtobacterium sp. MCSS17_015]|uniref:hypothetical protein n=1 Tax=Curtobacterium sp. MCSS17_015 TaxID=2175666 RepID=UPI0015E8C7C6|nr:hypothetical protein [Curtobacterium sp. MCSS17_015]WIB27536.1 hypothetical protein DEJ18_05460 [Curtobacterium sp. MCSS17_015]